MNEEKIKQSILPPIVGLILAFTLLFIYNKIIDSIYFPTDGDDADFLGDDFTVLIYSIAFFPMLIIAGIFQYFIAIPIWENYKKQRNFIGMRLWQLVITSSIIFGIVVVALFYNRRTTTIVNPTLAVFSVTIISLFYWIGNIYTLRRMLDNTNVN